MKLTAPLLAALLTCLTLPALAADNNATDAAAPVADAPPAQNGYLERAREVTIQALSLLGVHYKWGSDSPEHGFDCSGLVSHVFQQVAGIALPRNAQGMAKVGEKIDKSELQPGDPPPGVLGVCQGQRPAVPPTSRSQRLAARGSCRRECRRCASPLPAPAGGEAVRQPLRQHFVPQDATHPKSARATA